MLKVVPNGKNAKLGLGVATTYRPVGITCPKDCPLLGNGCYAQNGHVNIHQNASANQEDDLRKLAGQTMVRHLVSGDWLKQAKNGRMVLDREFVDSVIDLHKNAPWLTGWGYTHDAMAFARANYSPDSLPSNLHILASCDSKQKKTQLNKAGWRTARVILEEHEKLDDEFLCPVDKQKRDKLPQCERTSCARCQACFKGKRNIAFLKF